MSRDIFKGCLVRSRSGRDAHEIFFCIDEDERFAYIADGKNRRVDRPKKKNKKHLALMNRTADALVREEISKAPDDIKIRKLIREYMKVLQHSKEEADV